MVDCEQKLAKIIALLPAPENINTLFKDIDYTMLVRAIYEVVDETPKKDVR